MKRGYGIGLTILLGLSISVTGCKSGSPAAGGTAGPQASVTPGVSPSAAVSAAPSPSASATPAPGSVSPSPAGEAGTIQARLTGFAMTGEKAGFVWGLAADQTFRMYRTDDAGGHWTDVTPGARKAVVVSAQDQGRGVAVLDGKHVWVASGEREKSPVLYTTADGGTTWKTGTFPSAGNIVATSQVSPELGYMMTSSDAAMGHSEKELFSTKDGGKSWTKVMQNGGYIATKGETPNAIPQQGHANKGMTFRDASNGWVPLESPDDKMHLYRTKDGGKNWAEVTLPVPQGVSGYSYSVQAAPVFFGTDRNQGWFPAVARETQGDRLFGYFTNDGGEHWIYTPFGDGGKTVPGGGALSAFADSKNGWILNGDKLLRTTDGGKTWNGVTDQVLAGQLAKFNHPAELQFTSPQSGWLLLEAQDAKKSVLISTADGGQHWKVQ